MNLKNIPICKHASQVLSTLGLKRNNLNMGLYYQKFMDSQDKKSDKREFINRVVYKNNKQKNMLAGDYVERLVNLVDSLQGKFKIYELTEPLITGIGLEHPVEVGFLWEHNLGIPYIAGSTIKGITRDWARNWSQETEEDIIRIFGSEDTKNSQVGSVIFFDALPYKKANVKADIITPHYSPYYSQKECPGDWFDPNPIPFLTVCENQRFIFFIVPRKEKYSKDCLKVLKWLDDVLTTIGAGAKTATGYGGFVASESSENALLKEFESKKAEERRKKEFEAMSPIRQEISQDGYDTDVQRFMENLTVKWIKRLGESENDQDQKEIAKYLAIWYETNYPEQWNKPKGKNIDKVNKIKKFCN